MDRDCPLVIAVAAPMGGGKSALTQALALALNEQGVLAFDDYETASKQSIEALAEWLAQGADFDALEAPGLIDDLRALRDRQFVSAGNGTRSWQPNEYIVCEMPLGMCWQPAAGLIDHVVWIDVPPDLALARRVREIVQGIMRENAPRAAQGLAWLGDYLSHYEQVVHRVLAVQRERVRPGSDLVLDGTLPVDALVQQVQAWLARERAA